jgi:hypothetical protein
MTSMRDQTAACATPRQAAQAHAGGGEAPWLSMTKGECLLLALALHRLSKENARQRCAGEDQSR